MKTKSVITILSVAVNLALFATLAHFNKINSRPEGAPAPFFLLQHLAAEGQGVALASSTK